jgi:hypothetical protein
LKLATFNARAETVAEKPFFRGGFYPFPPEIATPGAEPAPDHGLSRLSATAALRPMVGLLSLVHPA